MGWEWTVCGRTILNWFFFHWGFAFCDYMVTKVRQIATDYLAPSGWPVWASALPPASQAASLPSPHPSSRFLACKKKNGSRATVTVWDCFMEPAGFGSSATATPPHPTTQQTLTTLLPLHPPLAPNNELKLCRFPSFSPPHLARGQLTTL